MHKKVEVGQRYGRLIVMKLLPGYKSLCKCDCGNEKIVANYNLCSGGVKSCGCLRRQRPIRNNLTGKRFGHLVVLKELGGNQVLCHCDCGTEKKFRKSSIVSGLISSCGCQPEKIPNVKEGQSKKEKEYDTELSSARLSAGKTQQKISDLLGVSIPVLSQWERGDRHPTPYLKNLLIEWYQAGCPELTPCNDIRAARQSAHLTQAAMSERFHIPIPTITKWENGKTTPAKYLLALIAWKLNSFSR